MIFSPFCPPQNTDSWLQRALLCPVLAGFPPAQQSLSVPLFAVVMEEPANDLAPSTTAAPSPLRVWSVLGAFLVPVPLAGFIPSHLC